jgi:hypothetical protein
MFIVVHVLVATHVARHAVRIGTGQRKHEPMPHKISNKWHGKQMPFIKHLATFLYFPNQIFPLIKSQKLFRLRPLKIRPCL